MEFFPKKHICKPVLVPLIFEVVMFASLQFFFLLIKKKKTGKTTGKTTKHGILFSSFQKKNLLLL